MDRQTGSGVLDPVALANAAGPGAGVAAIVADRHPFATYPADPAPLQQGRSFARRPLAAVGSTGAGGAEIPERAQGLGVGERPPEKLAAAKTLAGAVREREIVSGKVLDRRYQRLAAPVDVEIASTTKVCGALPGRSKIVNTPV